VWRRSWGFLTRIQLALNKDRTLPPEITPAEREIAASVKKCMNCRESAAVRGMGAKSVEIVRVVLRKKLGVDRRANLRAVLQDYGDL